MCWKLKQAMYVRRDAAQRWQRKCAGIARDMVLASGKVSPCHFFEKGWQVCGLIHGDFVFVGNGGRLKALSKRMGGKLKVKAILIGPEAPCVLRLLNRSIRRTREGMVHESDHRGLRGNLDEIVQEG